MEGRLDVETSNRPCGRISRSLAFAAMRKGEARIRRSKDRSRGDGLHCLTLRHGVKHRPCLICRTAVYGPVCTVVWEGRSRETPPIPIAMTATRVLALCEQV